MQGYLFLDIEYTQEVLYKGLDVFRPIAQRRYKDRKDIKTVVQVFAEGPARNSREKVCIRGGDDAQIDLNLLEAANTAKAKCLQDAQELRLQNGGHRADLIQEQRSLVSTKQVAHTRDFRIGVGPHLYTKEFGLQQAIRNGGTVDINKLMVSAAT